MVDGAGAWQRFRNITLPLVSPTTFFLLVIQMIGAFQLFSEPFVMTRGQGGPAHATTSLVFYIYQSAFQVRPAWAKRRRSPGCCSRLFSSAR